MSKTLCCPITASQSYPHDFWQPCADADHIKLLLTLPGARANVLFSYLRTVCDVRHFMVLGATGRAPWRSSVFRKQVWNNLGHQTNYRCLPSEGCPGPLVQHHFLAKRDVTEILLPAHTPFPKWHQQVPPEDNPCHHPEGRALRQGTTSCIVLFSPDLAHPVASPPCSVLNTSHFQPFHPLLLPALS